MKLIYRIEKDGFGPYTDRSCDIREYFGDNLETVDHPIPVRDSLLMERYEESEIVDRGWVRLFSPYDYKYGFENIDVLRRWFYNDNLIKKLHELEFELVIYKSENILHGRTQSIVLKGTEILIEKKNLLSVFDADL